MRIAELEGQSRPPGDTYALAASEGKQVPPTRRLGAPRDDCRTLRHPT
jgi:hypothetical protein